MTDYAKLAERVRVQCVRIKNATITGPDAPSHKLECNIVPDPVAIACADALDELLAERDRLRSALTELVAHWDMGDEMDPDDDQPAFIEWEHKLTALWTAARKAIGAAHD